MPRSSRNTDFEPGAHTQIIVTWGWTDEAKAAADAVKIELWDFRKIMREIAEAIHLKRSYFTDDTLRTVNFFVRALDDIEPDPKSGDRLRKAKPISSAIATEKVVSSPFWVYPNGFISGRVCIRRHAATAMTAAARRAQ